MTTTGWLVRQLPRAMQQDDVLTGLVLALEQVADSVRDRAASAEHLLDPDLATPEMLRYVASWLAVDVPQDGDPERHRALLRAVGRTLPARGTRACVEEVVQAATGARTRVHDGGGVYGPGDVVPPPDRTVVVAVDDTGGMTPRQLAALVRAELPLGAVLRLVVAGRPVEEGPVEDGPVQEGLVEDGPVREGEPGGG